MFFWDRDDVRNDFLYNIKGVCKLVSNNNTTTFFLEKGLRAGKKLFLGAGMLSAPENDFWGRSSHDLPLQIHVQKIKKSKNKSIGT